MKIDFNGPQPWASNADSVLSNKSGTVTAQASGSQQTRKAGPCHLTVMPPRVSLLSHSASAVEIQKHKALLSPSRVYCSL
ncbi:hypothetical protein I79_002494 [Cricetulus griseus]|uniref:Uncharacterized protein n=1 Tax=Cricetulus griseus TaxID=10029 RepID=G3GXK2_CRIGR|nr:hypothetical protein I79_002494 [Cricetulus griseus]